MLPGPRLTRTAVRARWDAALAALTANPAEIFGIAAERGRIAVGRPADFLVARGTPAQLPRKFSYLEGIWLGGRPSPIYRKNPQRSKR